MQQLSKLPIIPSISAKLTIIGLLFFAALARPLAQSLSKDTLAANQYVQQARKLFDADESAAANAKVLAYCQDARAIYDRYQLKNRQRAEVDELSGIVAFTESDYPKAIALLNASVQQRKQARPTLSDSTYLRAYRTLGEVYLKTKDYNQALAQFLLATDIVKKYPMVSGSVQLYTSLAVLYLEQNNVVQANRYLIEARRRLKILKPRLSAQEYGLEISVSNNNLARTLAEQGKYDEAKTIYREIIKTYPNKDLPLALYYNNLAKAHLELNQPDSALLYLQRVFTEKLPIANSPYENVVLRNMGKAYVQQKAFDRALIQLQAAAKSAAQLPDRKPLALVQLELAELYGAQSQWTMALQATQKAIIGLHREFKDGNVETLPPLGNVASPVNMLYALQTKARLQTQAFPLSLGKALKTYELCVSLMDSIRNGHEQEASRLLFTSRMYGVYEEAISVAHSLNQNDKAFEFAELSKANSLRFSLQNSQARKLVDLGSGEKALRQQVNRLQEQIVVATQLGQAKKQAVLDSLGGLLADAERAHQRYIKQIEQTNPRYYRLKYANRLATVADVQQYLMDDKSVLLEYFLGEKQLFTFVISKKEFKVLAISFDRIFGEQLANISPLITNLKSSYEDQTFQPAMRYWYNQLVRPAEPFLGDNVRRIILIPDGPLHKLPFDALIKPDGRYLVSRFILSRGYSATILAEASKAVKGDTESFFSARRPNAPADSLFLVAPFARGDKRYTISGNRDSLENLPYTQEEADGIRQLYGSTFSLSVDRAVKENFLKSYRRFGIIHLSTHAQADDNDPLASFVAFYPRESDSLRIWRLYTPEIYELDMSDVRLVVLSACETGDGEVLKGEGILSLARAFTYAGCPNLIMTLWNANDQAAKNINLAMYKYLKDGYPKDEALQLAKIDFLDTHGTNTNPYYWANFVFIGDSTPIYQAATSIWWYVFGGLIMLTALLVWLFKRKKGN